MNKILYNYNWGVTMKEEKKITKKKKKKKKSTTNFGTKIFAYIMLILMILSVVAGIVAYI